MATSVLERPEVRVESDPVTGVWTIRLGDRSYRVREWTWGERRRLVDSDVRDGTFLRGDFVNGLVKLLVSPAPEDEEVPVLAAAALRLLGVEPQARPVPLLAAEAAFASRWGWGPAQLDRQPASRMDRHLALMSADAVESSGWNRIEVVDG